MNAIDRLIEKIKQTNNPTVIGIDTKYEMVPKCITNKYEKDLEGVAKVQIAFYEMYGTPGMQTFKETCNYAKEKGMIVMADIKRGDIGSTASRLF